MKLLLAVFLIFSPSISFAATIGKIPHINIEIAVQQKEEGKINPSVHIMQLSCFNGECDLDWITIDACRRFWGSPFSSMIKLEKNSTRDNPFLIIKSSSKNPAIIEIEERLLSGSGGKTLRLELGASSPDLNFFNEITKFSGGLVKNSIILEKVITVEYVPLEATWGGQAFISFDCPIALPALIKKQQDLSFRPFPPSNPSRRMRKILRPMPNP